MARFLLLTGAAAGHVNPVMQIARKLIERGHEVVWITGRRYQQKVEATGARFHPFPGEIELNAHSYQDEQADRENHDSNIESHDQYG